MQINNANLETLSHLHKNVQSKKTQKTTNYFVGQAYCLDDDVVLEA